MKRGLCVSYGDSVEEQLRESGNERRREKKKHQKIKCIKKRGDGSGGGLFLEKVRLHPAVRVRPLVRRWWRAHVVFTTT